MATIRFYAVRRGREGPKIYNKWSECEKNTSGLSGARHKSFPTQEAARAWLEQPDNSYVEVSMSNPWHSDIVDTKSNHPISASAPESPPHVPLDMEPYTADFSALSDGSSPDPPSRIISSPGSTPVVLSEEQENILSLVSEGKNIFFTGSAGTGKSVLLRKIIDHFGGEISETLAITASTGIAAVNIGGTTLHSFAGIGLGIEDVERLIKKILSNKNSKKRWRRTRTLIIDEISMVDGSLFDKLEHIAREVRENQRPFGGIQLVLSGDFCQLPPVPERRNGVPVPILFAFEARSWSKCFDDMQSKGRTVYQLTKVFRQQDQGFVDMLNSMRNGQLDKATTAQFYKLSRPVYYGDGLEPCELFPLRGQVLEANQTRLRRIIGPSQHYRAMDEEGYDIHFQRISIEQAKKLLDRLVAPEIIEIKVGAQVMLIKNLVQGRLVNGSLGKVIDFQTLDEARRRKTEVAEIDWSKDLETQRRRQGQNAKADTHQSPCFTDNLWPVVRFTNGQTLLLTPAEFEVVNVCGIMEARRDQIPLILAWALSIHKSQGQTLERVKIDLGKTFEKGQAYVALSRATSMDGLQVLNFHPSKVMAHPRVLAWHEQVKRNYAKHVERPLHVLNESGDQMSHRAGPAVKPYDEFDEFDDPDAMESYWNVDLTSPG